MPETKFWICDTCGERINTVEDGWVEWIVAGNSAGERRGRNLRLVHHLPASPRRQEREYGCQINERRECDRNEVLLDQSLSDSVGPDGLMNLLSMLAEGELPKESVIEMIKRLHIPGYEVARLHFVEAAEAGIFEPNAMPGVYWQEDMDAVLRYMEEAYPEMT